MHLAAPVVPRRPLHHCVRAAALSLAALAGCADEFAHSEEPPRTHANALVARANTLAGMHDPPLKAHEIAATRAAFGSRGGWLVITQYSTDLDWLPGAAADIERGVAAGFTPVVRLDYARGESAWADHTRAPGATIPPPGDVGFCLERFAPPSSTSWNGGTHLNCYLGYIERLVDAAPGVHNWIVGNEMNLRDEARAFGADPRIQPGWYAEVFRAARARVRSRRGHERDAVFTGGPSPSGFGTEHGRGEDNKWMSGDEYLRQMLQALDPRDVDGVTVHAYGGWSDLGRNGGTPARTVFRDGWQRQLRLVDAVGHSRTPVLVTEFSVGTGSDASGAIIPAEARLTAQFFRDAYGDLRDWNWGPSNHNVLGAVFYSWHSDGYPEQSFDRLDVNSGADNPQAAFREIANDAGYPAGDPARFGSCTPAPGTGSDRFAETGFAIAGRLREYWWGNGGLAVFGYPLEDAACRANARTGRVLWSQWTERQRLEYHPLNGRPYDVLLGLLGSELASTHGVDPHRWESRDPGRQPDQALPGCRWIGPNDRTGHWVCGEVRRYWETHGLDFGDPGVSFRESLALFGYPVSGEIEFPAGSGRREQWFERARLERHEGNCGARDGAGMCTGAFYILGGLLGREGR